MFTQEWIDAHRLDIEELYDLILDEVVYPATEGYHHILTSQSDDGEGISTAICTSEVFHVGLLFGGLCWLAVGLIILGVRRAAGRPITLAQPG